MLGSFPRRHSALSTSPYLVTSEDPSNDKDCVYMSERGLNGLSDGSGFRAHATSNHRMRKEDLIGRLFIMESNINTEDYASGLRLTMYASKLRFLGMIHHCNNRESLFIGSCNASEVWRVSRNQEPESPHLPHQARRGAKVKPRSAYDINHL